MANEDYPRGAHTQRLPKQDQAYQQQYPPQYQQPYQQPRQMNMQPSDTTSTGSWMLTLFLAALPIIGFILMLVWAFGSSTAPSKKNWARANLLWVVIIFIVYVAIIVIAMAMGIDVQSYLNQAVASRA